MNWLNLNVTVLDSEEFLGADPVARATWLCLLRYCAGQENGGRIEGAKLWKDRKWQQVVRVTGEEILVECDLWSWDGADLIVWEYPVDKEIEVKANRDNGSRGGRPRKPIQNHPVSSGLTETKPPAETTRFEIAETERKGKEGNRKGTEEEAQDPCGLAAKVNSLRPEWGRLRHFTALELATFREAEPQLAALAGDDWDSMRDFLNYSPRGDERLWQVRSRDKFLQSPADVLTHANEWRKKHPKKKPPVTAPITGRAEEQPDLSKEQMSALLRGEEI